MYMYNTYITQDFDERNGILEQRLGWGLRWLASVIRQARDHRNKEIGFALAS